MTSPSSVPRDSAPADETIAFIGGGHMAASLIGGLLAAGCDAARIRVAVRTPESATRLHERFRIAAGCDVSKTVSGADIVLLAVKPQQLGQALAGVRLAPSTTAISVAAGVRVATLRRWLGDDVDLVRTMPNTPAVVQKGITGLFAPAGIAERSRQRAETVMRAAGSVVWVSDENALDALTAVSGCGPAYFFYLVEALREAGVALGLSADTSRQLAFDTFTGAAALAQARDEDVAELRRQVTSKGGATEAALDQLEALDFRGIVRSAVQAAAERSRERGLAAERELQP